MQDPVQSYVIILFPCYHCVSYLNANPSGVLFGLGYYVLYTLCIYESVKAHVYANIIEYIVRHDDVDEVEVIFL